MTSQSEKGPKIEHMAMAQWFVQPGLSTTPSAQTTEVKTPELWLGKQVKPTVGIVALTRKKFSPLIGLGPRKVRRQTIG
jgi:hypothetical protein